MGYEKTDFDFCYCSAPLFVSCEKELTNLLEGYYKESMGLKVVPLDSVTRFSSKFDGFKTIRGDAIIRKVMEL